MGILKNLFKKNKRQRVDLPDVFDIPNENERMVWGIKKANLTLHYFKECIENPKSGQAYFSLKGKFEDEENIEHIWLQNPKFNTDGTILGTIGNEPIDVTTVKIDEEVTISPDHISDWMIIENGRLIGGYTIRAIRDAYSGKELVSFDKSLGGMIVDDGEDYFVANLETPEGAIISLENAYNNDDIEAVILCKDFNKEAELLLQETLKTEIDNELISSTSEIFKLAFMKDIQENGMPKFIDIKRAFKRREISEHQCEITEICYYNDGGKSSQKFATYKTGDEWKVLGVVE